METNNADTPYMLASVRVCLTRLNMDLHWNHRRRVAFENIVPILLQLSSVGGRSSSLPKEISKYSRSLEPRTNENWAKPSRNRVKRDTKNLSGHFAQV
ncbi:hypothetical protein WN51_11205 [Melipona quadrifasciata]|uniref:Uncharacterized protein n=1 Tax=Melipona quadrifasciata TaxID=166423 RepID=A0A0N0BHU2_9HYME|nr:hypothetical protein WN51_11205 [Melipona quadrifasciata]